MHPVEPIRPLAPCYEDVVELLAKGWSYKAIAKHLHLSVRTVQKYILQVAELLPYRDEFVSPRDQVMLWAVHRVWHRHMTAAAAAVT